MARRELGEFLRSRRARLTPAEVGLPATDRRRTPGLRREEVCQLAHVSYSWYTWVEQGRSMHASPGLLMSVCRALRLEEAEIAYIFELIASTTRSEVTPLESTPPNELIVLLDGLVHTPAMLYDYCWDPVACNRAFDVLFPNNHALPAHRRNLLRMAFDDLPDKEARRSEAVARFRSDFSRRPGDARMQCLVDAMCTENDDFRRRWSAHDVAAHQSVARLTLTRFGIYPMYLTHFQPYGWPDFRVVIMTPPPGSDVGIQLERLLEGQDADAVAQENGTSCEVL